jgi:hypothetical protein
MSDYIGDGRVKFGVLFVGGFKHQRRGSAVASLAGALYRWLFKWNARGDAGRARRSASSDRLAMCDRPVLRDVALSGAGGEDGQPAHLTLSVPLQLSTGKQNATWLLAESSWADLFVEPRFLGLARWVWKVSTCLLVLQFLNPMRRHRSAARWDVTQLRCRWRAAKPECKLKLLWRLAADRALAGVYLVLMGVAAMLSVLLAALLLAVALAAYLPIPRIDKAVRWVVAHIAAMLGDSYMLAHCPVQFAAMRTQVASDLARLQERCDKIAVVAHSQGAALAHQVLKDGSYDRRKMKAFITLGQGIAKFDVMWRLDWDPDARARAQRSRVFVTAGMACAGLPAAGLVVGHWWHAALVNAVTGLPWWPLLLAAGFASIARGVFEATHAVRDHIEEDLRLPHATFTWRDYYASADPVSNGQLPSAAGEQQDQLINGKPSWHRITSREVYNSGSVNFDHNGYLRNYDELLPSLLNDLAAAAYGTGTNDADQPELVRVCDVEKSSKRRRWWIRWLIAARLAAIALMATLVWADPGRILKQPMQQLMHLFAAPAEMNNDTAIRILAAALITAAFYAAAVIVWRAGIRRSVRLFFRSPPFPPTMTHPGPDAPANQDASANQAAMAQSGTI